MEELNLSVPENVELQPVGTVSSIIQQLGKRACQSSMGLGLTSVENSRAWNDLCYIFSRHPVAERLSTSDGRQHPIPIWQGGLGQGGWPSAEVSFATIDGTFLKSLMWACPGSLFQVFEVFGPVSSPLYILRFNSADQIVDKGLMEGMTVYYAPSMKEYTGYILVQDLKL